jgi:hypothetical protein
VRIAPSHPVQVLHALVNRLEIPACSGYPSQLALSPHADLRMVRFDPSPLLRKRVIQLSF